jgi:transposase
LDEAGEEASEGRVATTKPALTALFAKMASCRIALEVGTHSPWVSRHLAAMGHEVIVANAHRVKLITQSVKKNDRIDAERLARLARVDPKLLSPIQHRGAQAQADLAVIRARAGLVDVRTTLINTARGLTKPMGERLKKCDADYVNESLAEGLSEDTIRPLLKAVEEVTKQIKIYEQNIEEIGKRHPEMKLLRQVHGVGTLIALTYILTIEDAQRFAHSRDVGPYLGMTRKQRDSGDSQPELRISKAADQLLRRLLVQGAHCILRRGAPDSDLRTWGLALQQGDGKKSNSKRRKKTVAIAVARKLAVLLHRLWVSGEVVRGRIGNGAAVGQPGKRCAINSTACLSGKPRYSKEREDSRGGVVRWNNCRLSGVAQSGELSGRRCVRVPFRESGVAPRQGEPVAAGIRAAA